MAAHGTDEAVADKQQMLEDSRSSSSSRETAAILALLPDAHCHPQLDPAHLQDVPQLQCGQLAAMSVSCDVDWDIMLRLHRLAGPKVVPGFGIHPWWSHLHASPAGDTWQQLLKAPSPEQLQAAIDILRRHDPVTNSGAYATNRPSSSSSGSSRAAAGDDGDDDGAGAERNPAQPQQSQRPCLGNGLRVVPQQEWEGRLRQLLADIPSATVGEIGLDRAATIPGSKAKTSLKHQLELVQRQMAIAAEFGRPVSVHCVRGYGHMLQLLSGLAASPGSCPPKIMLHSYGGSVEDIPKFCALRNIGNRVYFSFSHAINAVKTPEKLLARIAAVPDDRLLIESDQVSPLVIEQGMLAICQLVAGVKGWSDAQAAQQLAANFAAFYAAQLQQQQQQPAVVDADACRR